MSIPVLVEVYDEVRRLAIAGSVVAPGDFRLKKLIGPLEKSGEKAAVFVKVAQAAQALVDSNDKTASAALLELATLVNAILYTQATTGAAGELEPIETRSPTTEQKNLGARVLKPLLEALTRTGSGRFEPIREAFERGDFHDLRLVKPALEAIDDPHAEIGNLMADRILPTYGQAIVPELAATIDLKGRAGHVRRLQLMHRLDPAGTRALVSRAIDEGSKEMRVAAIECLGAADEDQALLLEQAAAKSKDVRGAALRALVKSGLRSKEVLAAVHKAIAGADLETFLSELRQSSDAELHALVIRQAGQQLAVLLESKDKKRQGELIAHLLQLVQSMIGWTESAAELFLLHAFSLAAQLASIKSEPAGADLNEVVASAMARGSDNTRQRLAAAHESLRGPALVEALFAARASLTPAAFFKQFSPALEFLSAKKTKKNEADVERAAAVKEAVEGNHHLASFSTREDYLAHRAERDKLAALDPRWLDVAVKCQDLDLVAQLARPDHAGVRRFLSEQLAALNKTKAAQEVSEVLEIMIRVGHPQATDAVIECLQFQVKTPHSGYYSYWIARLITELPASAVPQLEALLPTLPERLADQLLESLIKLKNQPERNSP